MNEFTSIGFGADNAMGHAWDAQGRLYVAGFASRDIKQFDINGNYLGVFISAAAGQLQGPVNIWFDNSNNLFVEDWQANNVKKYNAATGALISVFISGLNNPEGFTFDRTGNIYISNYTGNTVNKYDANGNFLGVVVSGGGLSVCNSVIIGPSR
jgi:sugar lactone lactonase YvrE